MSALAIVLTMAPASVWWSGLPCSTFVRRTNKIMLRRILLCFVAVLRQVFVAVEQPASSTVPQVPHLKLLAGVLKKP